MPHSVNKEAVVGDAAGSPRMQKTILSDEEAKVLAFYVLTKELTYSYFYCVLATLAKIG